MSKHHSYLLAFFLGLGGLLLVGAPRAIGQDKKDGVLLTKTESLTDTDGSSKCSSCWRIGWGNR